MRLAGAELIPFSVPLRCPLSTSRAQLERRDGFLLRLVTDSGLGGVGEASPPYWIGGEQLAETRASLERVTAYVRAHPETDELREWISRSVAGKAPARLSPAALCALDTALLDICARARKVSVATLLGGDSDSIVAVSWLLSASSQQALAEEARAAVQKGYRVFKLKVGAAALDADVKKLEVVRASVGSDLPIRLDANRAWTLAQARRALGAFKPFAIEFVEEPLRAAAPGPMLALKSATGMALALDESVTSNESLAPFVQCKAADAVVLKVARLGGPTICREMARLALRDGLKVVITDSLETPIGMKAACHLAAALALPHAAVGLGGARYLLMPAANETEFEESAWQRVTGPGLTVAALKRYAKA